MTALSNYCAFSNLDGSYDEVRIYDRALTLNQILGNMAAGSGDLIVVPEPTSIILLVLGIVGLAVARLCRKRA